MFAKSELPAILAHAMTRSDGTVESVRATIDVVCERITQAKESNPADQFDKGWNSALNLILCVLGKDV